MTNKKKRIIHSPEFKAEALKLAEIVGVEKETAETMPVLRASSIP